ncbi:MAG: IS66 family transposase [Roseburia sp.]
MQNIDELRKKLSEMDREELINYTIEQQITKEQYLEQLRVFRTKKFSKTSEKVSPDQLSLFNEAEAVLDSASSEELVEEAIAPKPKKRRKEKTIDRSKLDVKTIHHELEDMKCSKCGSQMKETAPSVVEVLRYQPAKFYIEKHIIHNYECRQCFEMAQGNDAPVELVEGSIVSAEVVAGIAREKFVMGTPLYRQEQDLKRKQIYISRQNMSNWLVRCAEDYLKFVFERMHRDIQKCDIVHMDETTLVVIEDKETRDKSYEWLLMSGREEEKQMALYFYNESREYKTLEWLLTLNKKRYILSDGYAAYHSGEYGIDVGCMAHLRRYFHEAMEASPSHKVYEKIGEKEEKKKYLESHPGYANTLRILAIIQKIFEVDRIVMEAEPEKRMKIKTEKNLPLFDELFEFIKSIEGEHSCQSKMGKAITYAINIEPYVRNYFKDGRLEVSNNRAERKIKPFVTGRKNWLFSKTKRGAQSSSIYYSLIETAIMNQLDPYKYLVYVLERLSRDGLKDKVIEEVLPYSKTLPKELYTKIK